MNRKLLHIWLLTQSSLGLALTIGSCGKVAEPAPLYDSNTNWLLRCSADGQCSGSLRCYCGICTKPCGQDAECGRLKGAQCEESGEVLCGERASAGGLCVLGCTQNSECGGGFDCTQGQCVPQPCAAGQSYDWDDVFQIVNQDLAQADAEDQPYYRYIAIGNDTSTAEDGGCGLRIEFQRQALIKLVNSLSINAAVEAPVPIDAAEQIARIDLRDYVWEREIFLGGQTYPDAWEALSASSAYALPFIGDAADDAAADTATATPILMADALIAAATEPSVYYALLDISQPPAAPLTALDDFFLNQLAIDPTNPPELEAGFTEGDREFIARMWPIEVRAGYLWMISDFGRPAGSLFENPLDAPLGEHELIFTLPNGVNAFLFMSADGQLIDGWNATLDSQERDGVSAPRSNLRRHSPRLGIRDEVRESIDQNPVFSDSVRTFLEMRFRGPEALELQLRQDYFTYQGRALNSAGVDPEGPDPILQSYAFFDSDVTLEAAAADLMITPEDLRGNLDLLDPQLAPLALAGGTVPRSTFTLLYANTLCILSTPLENQPDPALCP
jgi:hypothetical protein